MRLDLSWLYDSYFQLLINCSSGRVHVNLYLDFSRAHPKKLMKNSGYERIIFAVGK